MSKCSNYTLFRFKRHALFSIIEIIGLFNISPAINFNRLTTDTLAIIYNTVITSEIFAQRYKEKLVKYGLTDNFETRRGYLQNLIDDEILISHAKLERLDCSFDAIKELSRIRTQELLNVFVDKHILPAIQSDDNDLKELFVKLNTKIKVSHLYASNKHTADSLYIELSNGKGFSEIAKEIFTDPRLKNNGGSLGYISIDEMDPDFENAAFSMRVGTVSKPVKTVQGYSIIKVDDIQRNPFVTESEFLKVRDKLKAFSSRRKTISAMKEYSARLRSKLNLIFFNHQTLQLFKLLEASNTINIENWFHPLSKKDFNKPVLTSTFKSWNVSDVIDVLKDTKDNTRKWIHSKEDFENFIAGQFLQRYICELAQKEKLDKAPSFVQNVNYLFDSYLLASLEDRLKAKVMIPNDSINNFYLHNRDRFKTEPEIRLSAILLDEALKVDSVKRLLESGVKFEDAAKLYSTQRYTSEQGGDLGYFRASELGNFGTKIFSLEVKAWTGPLSQEGKYLFVQCTDKKASKYKTLKESSKEIEDYLKSLAWIQERSQYVEIFKKEIKCQTYPEHVRAIIVN